jgi:integrase
MRGSGRIFHRAGTAHWWISYYHHGKEVRESSGSPDPKRAERLLKHRLAELGADRLGQKPFLGPAQRRVTFEDLAHAYLQDYAVRGLRSADTAVGRVMHLRAAFADSRAIDITPTRLRAYQAERLAAQANPATVNRELSALRRMFALAVSSEVLASVPRFPARLGEAPPRQGFFEHAEYLAIRAHLPPDYQDVLDFGYHSGWRRREITQLTWAEVDLPGGVVCLDPERSKTKLGRLLPVSPPLRDVLARRLRARRLDTPLVFHHHGGHPVRDWRYSWRRACRTAGLPGKLFHDLRRTVVRNLVRSGVPERVAMAITGHKTRAVFDRYNIVSETDLRQATARLAEYVAEQPAAPTVVPLARTAEAPAR